MIFKFKVLPRLMLVLLLSCLNAYAEPLQPLSTMQTNPAMLRFFDPVAVATPQEGHTSLAIKQSYSTIFLADALPNPLRYLADMELYIAEFKLAHRINVSSSLYIRLPVLRPNAGLFDPFLRRYHEAIGLPNAGRNYRQDNQYAYQYSGSSGGWSSQPRWELGNISAQWRYAWYDQDKLQLSHALGIKIPTASRARGWSNGGVDLAFAMVAAWQSESWASHSEIWWIHPLKRQDFGSPIQDYMRSNFNLGYDASYPMKATWLVGIQGGTSPYNTTTDALDQAPWLISAGVQMKADSGIDWKFAFTENITQASTQDFGISIEMILAL